MGRSPSSRHILKYLLSLPIIDLPKKFPLPPFQRSPAPIIVKNKKTTHGGIAMSFVNKQTWEYLVRDFLEIKCTLKEPEQEFLLDFLKGKGVRAEAIQMHPAFSVDDHLVVIMEDADSKKRLFYHPQRKTIEE
jgi:hypothetical protein